MHKYLQFVALAVLSLASVADVSAEDKFHRLKVSEIKAVVIGKSVTDEYHWEDTFIADGSLSGHQLGNAQTGSWKLNKSGEICVVRATSHKPKDDEPDCVEIWMRGNEVQYRRGGIVLSEGILKTAY
jgi:hypothetical protein